ncbi:MAG: acetamidase/formamidase family protein [Vicinamibacterales bacterium]
MFRTGWMVVWLASVWMPAGAAAAGLSGDYIAQVSASPTAEPQYARVALVTEGSRITGTWGDRRVTGSLDGARVTLTLNDAGGGAAGRLTGTIDGTSATGDGTLVPARGRGGPGGRPAPGGPETVTWTLTAFTPPSTPQVHDFAPTSFYTTYSARWEPVLRIYPGDTVRTRTVDNDRDAAATRYGSGGNPSTGPFYIEGALPGDTLVVHLRKVRANKRTARQGSRINARAVTAAHLAAAEYEPGFAGEWALDLDTGVARLTNVSERMKDFTVPIRTMLGCVSVAPPGQDQMRGTDLGVFGGNLDYNDNVEGTTLYFPVFHAGALFGIGDAHAAQGDGEVTGSALETSADVEFTVEVIKGESYPQVRAETAESLVSFGVSGSVPESIQAATTQLADWLKHDYALSDHEVALFLGAVLQYDIAELVDPHLNVAAKVPKSAVAMLRKP